MMNACMGFYLRVYGEISEVAGPELGILKIEADDHSFERRMSESAAAI